MGTLRENLAGAALFWERKRVIYNLVLTAVAIAWGAVTWPHFRGALTLFHMMQLLVLALLANVCYSAAYLVDIGMQSAGKVTTVRWRWALWTAGTLLAIVAESYWIADEIYPDFS
jgi:hypothetical protein